MSDSLLHRWSRQKAETKLQESTADKGQAPESDERQITSDVEDELTTSAPDESEQDQKEPTQLPPIESLDENSDYSMFMSAEVDEALRKLALRKLFKSPMFNVVDGLNDYDDDFTTFEALGDIVTSDMRFHEERKKAEQELAEQQSAEPQDSMDAEEIEPHVSEVADDRDEGETDEEHQLADTTRTDGEEANSSDDSTLSTDKPTA